jgi:hypothetical protein
VNRGDIIALLAPVLIVGLVCGYVLRKHEKQQSFPGGSCSVLAVECAAKGGRLWVSHKGAVECTKSVEVNLP